jgi:hypothetical protein
MMAAKVQTARTEYEIAAVAQQGKDLGERDAPHGLCRETPSRCYDQTIHPRRLPEEVQPILAADDALEFAEVEAENHGRVA